MHLFKISCIDRTGAAARITQALFNAGINAWSMRFETAERRFVRLRRQMVGEGEIVVKDEDWKLVSLQLQKLATDRKNLDLRVSKPYYRVTIAIPNRSGALNDELQKLAQNKIDIRGFASGDPRPDNTVLVRIILECSLEKYNLAKRQLKDCLQEESPFLATAVQDL
jgi:formyltetrahydrofolate hydrolase